MSYIIFNKTLNKVVIDADSDCTPPDNIFITTSREHAEFALERIQDLERSFHPGRNNIFEIRES